MSQPTTAMLRLTLARAARLWGLALACVVPLLLVAVVALWLGRQHTPQPFRPFEAVTLLVEWTIWATLAPLIVGIVWRIPLSSGRWIGGMSAHLVISAVAAVAEFVLFIVIVKALGGYPQATFADAFWRLLALWYPYALLVYWVIAVAAHAVFVSRRARDWEIESAQLREELTAAQLDALRMQLQPHFLCNSLNAAAVFLRDGQMEQAGRMVTGLGTLLHSALDHMDADEVTLREELTFVTQYLEIERIRFSDRMHVAVTHRGEVLDCLVPWMILQPLVENAIRHGIARDPRAGVVAIEASRVDGQLVVSVRDDGPGPTGGVAGTRGHGVGLLNARMRLSRHYGDRGRLDLRSAGEGGAIAEISLPYHTRPGSYEDDPAPSA